MHQIGTNPQQFMDGPMPPGAGPQGMQGAPGGMDLSQVPVIRGNEMAEMTEMTKRRRDDMKT